jgi:hypothetical protein
MLYRVFIKISRKVEESIVNAPRITTLIKLFIQGVPKKKDESIALLFIGGF